MVQPNPLDDMVTTITGPTPPAGGQSGPIQTRANPTTKTGTWPRSGVKSNPPFEDVMNLGKIPNTGPNTKGDNHFNIDEEKWTDNDWQNNDIDLHLPPADQTTAMGGDPCLNSCHQKALERERRCDIVRKRVQHALYKAGCPTTLTKGPPMDNSGCGYTHTHSVSSTAAVATPTVSNSDQSMTTAPSLSQSRPSIVMADVNNDGVPDIIMSNAQPVPSGNVSMAPSMMASQPNPVFSQPTQPTSGGAFSSSTASSMMTSPVVSADVTGDGRPDIIMSNNQPVFSSNAPHDAMNGPVFATSNDSLNFGDSFSTLSTTGSAFATWQNRNGGRR